MISPKRYIFIFTLFFLGFSALTVSINYLIDPYLMLGTKRWQGFNLHKVEIGKHLKMSKAYHPSFKKWDTLLVGNSRIEMGLNPQHSCFKKAGNSVYNLGLPGASVHQQLKYALNLIYQQPVKQVFLSVDFVDFLILNEWPSPTGEPDWSAPSGRLQLNFDGTKNPDYAWKSFMDHYRALYSLDALFSSFRTLALQSPHQSDRDNHGFNPARDYQYGVNIEGAHAFFAQKMAVLEKKYSKNWSLKYSDTTLSQSFLVLEEFLDIAKREGVKVTVFTNPFHQQFWDLLQENNLYDAHQVWLDKIKSIIATSEPKNISLWDFSVDSMYIHEDVPNRNLKGNPLTWFWEPAHYRKELGDLMLNTMLSNQCQTEAEFGKKLL